MLDEFTCLISVSVNRRVGLVEAEESREMLGVMPLQVFPQPQDPCPDTSA